MAQGKYAGTDQNKIAGWAHNLAFPVEIYLADNLRDVIRRPVEAVSTLYGQTLYEYSGEPVTAEQMANNISSVRSDMYKIEAEFTLNPSDAYTSGIYVRYNPTENYLGTEKTVVSFSNNQIFVNRSQSSLLSYVDKGDTWHIDTNERNFKVNIYVDRSQLEVYVNDIMMLTTRIYPKYGDSDYISLFDSGGDMKITKFKVIQMKGCFSDEVEPAYYGNTGNLAEAI